jgi:hypothetical protein
VSSVVRVPPELAAFLRLPPPQALMIRGPPGSGKTMLSLALLESFQGRRIYVSLRTTRQSLLDLIPWLGKLSPGNLELIDANTEIDHVQQHLHGPREIGGMLAREALPQEADQFLWLPGAVQSAWSSADPRHPTLIIFDSWDAVIDQYFERGVTPGGMLPSRIEIERKVLAQMMLGKIILVLVLERDTPTVIDYHVDRVVETSRLASEERLERWLALPKLRGVSIGTDMYPFTLAHGKFSAITPASPGERYELRAPAPDPRPEVEGMWPGASDYASGLGRLRPGEFTLLELDSAVPREIPRVILGPMLVHALCAGGHAIIFPPPSSDPNDAYTSLRDHVPLPILRERLRVLSAIPPSGIDGETSEVYVPAHKIGWTKTGPAVPLPEDPAFLHAARGSAHPNLIVAYLSGLQALAESANLSLTPGILAGLGNAIFPQSRVHDVVVGRTGDSRLDGLGPVMETHLRIRCPHGRVFLNGHRPYLSPLVLSQESTEEPYRLTPVL